MKIIRAKNLTMLVTTGEEASWSTEQWAPRVMNEGFINPTSPREMGNMKSISSCQKGRLWTPQTGSQRQGKRGRSPLELSMYESLCEGLSGLSLLHNPGEFLLVLNQYQLPTSKSSPQTNSAFQQSCLPQLKPC